VLLVIVLLFDLLHIVVVARGEHLFIRLEFLGLFLTLALGWLLNAFLVKRLVQLDFGVLENISKVLSDSIFRAQILFSKINSFLVAKNSGRV